MGIYFQAALNSLWIKAGWDIQINLEVKQNYISMYEEPSKPFLFSGQLRGRQV